MNETDSGAEQPYSSAYQDGADFAKAMDAKDPLRIMRDQFHIPTQKNGEDEIYLCGNSLGLQPKLTRKYLLEELDKWQRLGVKGHFDCEYPWMPYHEFLAEESAKLVGAKTSEVVSMNTLTANLHFMMVSFYRPTNKRYRILIEDHAFPSDHYAVESQIKFHGFEPEKTLLLVKPREGESVLRTEDICDTIERFGDEIALVMLPGVQYYTGEVLDMARITEVSHQAGANVGFDLAHAAGNIPMQLHQWNVDFAAWCTYKYLNSGPGSVAGCFVHERHHGKTDLPRFAGWWGHDKQSRFKMENHFVPIPTAEAWQLSNPPILSLAAIRASLDTVKKAGGIEALRTKSLHLSGYCRYLLETRLKDKVSILTPRAQNAHGCQLSLTVTLDGKPGKSIFEYLESQGVTCDWREPNVIRIAPVPLYNRYSDVYRFVDILQKGLNS